MENEEKQRIIKWVNHVLKDESFDKINIAFPDFYNTGGGYAAEMTFVDVAVEKRESKEIINLIVKKSKIDFTSNSELDFIDLYKNEINLYSKIVPYFQNMLKEKHAEPFKNIPKCYGTVSEDNRYIIILENLKIKNYKLHDITKPFDLVHVKLVLEAYANWHALSFALKDQDPRAFEKLKEYNKGFANSKTIDFFISTIYKEIDYVVEIYEKKKMRSDIIEKLKILKGNFKDLCIETFRGSDEDYEVIRHGDCWNNNFLFHYKEENADPDEVVIIDWNELDHLDNLLKFYYDTLSRKLIELGSNPDKCFPKNIFLEKFKKYAPFGCAGAPLMTKMSCKSGGEQSVTIDEVLKQGNFNKLLEGEILNPNEYFNRIDGVLNFCLERGFL
ncbi:hypothetical protein HHI36_002020 [Cryptolaemus montrouzieri]|uniref:CHK kinase-like domain-containing protein n=1 Tax=Cryptolaemus montrouzieri TaxID=559131 RepID=A0ABD2P9Y0_9CUCU